MMAILLVLFAVLSSSLLASSFVDAANDNTTIEVFNPLTAFHPCSNGEKKWRFCHSQYDYGPQWYCPTVLEFNASQVEDRFWPCFTCPDAESDCEKVVKNFLTTHSISEEATYGDYSVYHDDYWDINIADKLVLSCQELCEAGKKGDACSTAFYDENYYYHGDSCTPGSQFCDFASDEEFAMNVSGTCKACPLDPNECYQDDFVTSIEGRRNCVRCRLYCLGVGTSRVTVNGKEIPSHPISDAIQKSYLNASGSLFNCSKLLLESEDECSGAEGHVCIVDYSILRGSEVGNLEWQVSNEAEKSGCLAILSIGGFGYHHLDDLAIPFIIVEKEVGPSAIAQVEVQVFGSTCYRNEFVCNIGLPCSESSYCDYDFAVVNGEYTQGYCQECPKFENGEADPAGCFFDRRDYYFVNIRSWINPEAVKSCAKSCNATIISGDCKFCPSEVSALDFGVEDKVDQCYFCPENDVQHPQKNVRLFGENITCRMVQTFFNRMEIHKESANCHLVQSMNYLCGCDGTGYAGAKTHKMRVVLAWLPRVSAILSLGGSIFIIYDTMRTSQKRAKLMNQLLSTLSLFDIMGSTAYALTTLPTPESDELYGAKGNKRTCRAQGFFIQIGTIACFLNVSLALYYLLTIKYGWTEQRLKRKRLACFLFIFPIGIGLVLAFVGILFYDNVRVWCNNSAKWWPEVPVILAIIAATGIMGTLCHHVYSNEKRSARYASNGPRLSMTVFKQSCWFVAAFYITWVPYLTLQFMLSSGTGYNNYGLIISAATLVPLQGFWNNFIYIRPRYLSKIAGGIFSSIRRILSLIQRSSKADATKQSALNSTQLSGLPDQLQVVHVYETGGISSQDKESNNADMSNEKETVGETMETCYREILDPKPYDLDGEAGRGVSRLYEHDAIDTKENVVIEDLLIASKIEPDQDFTCPASGQEITAVGAIHENSLEPTGPSL